MSIKTNRAACNANTTFMILITSYIPSSQKVGETTYEEELHSKIFCKIEKKKKKEKGADNIDKSNVFNIPDILLHQ